GVLPGPAARRGLGPGQLDRVDLDHDLRLELLADPETQVFVGGPGEAVDAGVAASPVRVDGPAEREVGGVDPVQDALGLDLVEGEAPIGAPAGHAPAQFEEPSLGGSGPAQVAHDDHLTRTCVRDKQGSHQRVRSHSSGSKPPASMSANIEMALVWSSRASSSRPARWWMSARWLHRAASR